jgi:NAD-dependent dihydropyrimidine dehydrogenase PreA subunit
VVRKIITIDETICNGCGDCMPNCPEGALKMIDGKARLISDLFCDGLGACIGHCPVGAITIEEREAESYDEKRVMANVVKQGTNTVIAHLDHLKSHGEKEFLAQALDFIKENDYHLDITPWALKEKPPAAFHGCPGSRVMEFGTKSEEPDTSGTADPVSELRQWPIQLTLIPPNAPYLRNADLVIAADCVPFAYANFHKKFLKGKALAQFCPKLDQNIDEYIEKLSVIFRENSLRSVTVVHMTVPCCFGTGNIVKEAMERSGKDIPVEDVTVSIQGELVD